MRFHAFAACLLAWVLAAPMAAQQPSSSATDLAQALQKKYATIRDFSADFVHTYQGGVLKKQITEKGRLSIKKPGKMRWDYTSPEVKQFVSDGIKVYSYIPADKQVLVGTVPPDDTAGSPALFLAGKGDLVRDYTASSGEVPAGTAAGTRALKLVPRKPQQDYDWLVLLVDPVSLSLRGMVTVDAQGGKSVFSFSGLKENVGLADKDFEFHMPRGVDVVTDAGGR
ncbi:MAG: outer membrane lipoprotein carrier protein LolA [Vicinamibacterales bacterium]